MSHGTTHRTLGGELIVHFSDETWSASIDFAPPTSRELVDEFGIAPYVDWDEAEDDDGVAPARPVLRPPSTEWSDAPADELVYDETWNRWHR